MECYPCPHGSSDSLAHPFAGWSLLARAAMASSIHSRRRQAFTGLSQSVCLILAHPPPQALPTRLSCRKVPRSNRSLPSPSTCQKQETRYPSASCAWQEEEEEAREGPAPAPISYLEPWVPVILHPAPWAFVLVLPGSAEFSCVWSTEDLACCCLHDTRFVIRAR